MWLHPVCVDKNVRKYISPKLCLTQEIKPKYFRIGECVGIGQTTVLAGDQSWPFFITFLCLVTEILCLVILRVRLNKLGVTVVISLISFWNRL